MHLGLSLALVVGAAFFAGDDPDWATVWADLDRLEAAEPGSAEADTLRASLAALAAEQATAVRGALLARHLGRLRGAEARPWPEVSGDAWPFAGREGWLAAEVLPPGPERVRAVLKSMDEAAPGLDRRYLMTAWSTAVAEARALRLEEGALPIQTRLHAELQAPWTAVNLSLTSMWLDRHDEADRLLADAIAAEAAAGRPTDDLWSQRGIAALATGDKRRARDYLGRALAGGSANAAVVLARMDLDAGRRRAARIGFRALLWDDNPGAWALRGWGLTLLPDSPSGPIPSDRSIGR